MNALLCVFNKLTLNTLLVLLRLLIKTQIVEYIQMKMEWNSAYQK